MNPFDISGKVVLITGGTRGLGRAISLHFASQGATVVAGYFQNENAAEQFRQTAGQACSTIKANLMTSTGIQAVCDAIVSRYGRLDSFVYNSATGVHKSLDALTQRHLSAVWQLNVGAFFDLSLKLRSVMPRGARIVAISSEGERAMPSINTGRLEVRRPPWKRYADKWQSNGLHREFM